VRSEGREVSSEREKKIEKRNEKREIRIRNETLISFP
jgi:hypothetical protein